MTRKPTLIIIAAAVFLMAATTRLDWSRLGNIPSYVSAIGSSSGSPMQFLRMSPSVPGWAYPQDVRADDFAFSPITPTGSPSIGVGSNTVTISLAPLGFKTSAYSVYISGGTGTAEAVTVTGGTCTPSATACTVTFTAANTHSGAYTFSPNGGGIFEAVNYACAVNVSTGITMTVHVGQADHNFYPNTTVPAIPVSCEVRVKGLANYSNANVYGTTGGFFDVGQSHFEITGMNFQAKSTQVSGGFAIRLGNSAEISGGMISQNSFTGFWDQILSVNAHGVHIENNDSMSGFLHTAITAADASGTDDVDVVIVDNDNMQTGALGSPALACVNIVHGAGHVSGGSCYSSDSTSLPYGVYAVWAASSSGLHIGNGFYAQGTYTSGIFLSTSGSAFYQQVTIDGFKAVSVGTGTGVTLAGDVEDGVVTNSVFQGGSIGVNAYGDNKGWYWGGNVFDLTGTAYNTNTGSSADVVTVGPSVCKSSVTTPVVNGGVQIILENPCPMTYSQLGGWGNSSEVKCTNCKNSVDDAVIVGAACVSGGHGAKAVRQNGSWRCY